MVDMMNPKIDDPKESTATKEKPVDPKEMESAHVEVNKADIAVIVAQAKIVEAKKTPEEKVLDKAIADADVKRAKVVELQAKSTVLNPMTVETAKVMAPVPGDMHVGDHMAQKFGNDPENPKLGSGMVVTGTTATVLLSRKSPDHPELIKTWVHPEMVGDYLRAGWNRY